MTIDLSIYRSHIYNHLSDVTLRLLYKRFKSNMIVNMIGQWQETEITGQSVPVGGPRVLPEPAAILRRSLRGPHPRALLRRRVELLNYIRYMQSSKW